MKALPLSKLLIGIFAAATLAILGALTLYFLEFPNSLPNERDTWGMFGDFMGGVLNPILSFLALIALLSTLYFQSEELKISRADAIESRKELSRSAKAQEELGLLQLKQLKIQEFSTKISVIKLLLSYDGTKLMEFFNGGMSSSTIDIKEYAGASKKQLLKELSEIYLSLKNIES